MFRQIALASLPERIAGAIKDAVYSGQLKPGDAIVEREVARQMNIGTSPVREALILLEERGFVRRPTRRHAFVREFEDAALAQLCPLRMELECIAFRWAKPHINKTNLEELQRLLTAARKAIEAGHFRQAFEKSYLFRQRCWQLSDNSYLLSTLTRLVAPMFALVLMTRGVQAAEEISRENVELMSAFSDLEEPEFSSAVREILAATSQSKVGVTADHDHCML